MDSATRFLQYQMATIKKNGAYQQYSYASTNLNLCQIEERNAELASQCFETVAEGKLHRAIGPISDREREIGITFARYAVFGRCDQ